MSTSFDDLLASIPDTPFKGFYVNKEGGRASIEDLALISHVEDNLYVGGCLHGVDLGDFFSHVFSMYRWEAYTVDPETKVYTVTMYDAHGAADPIEVDDLAARVSNALDTGGNVLVHCQAGINRSNLVAAAALVRRGRTPSEAITLLRNKRHRHVLANRSFEDYVNNLR